MTIADRIRLKREELSLTQEELAARCGYTTKSSITKIEKSGNDITLKKIKRVADALGVAPSYLMGWEDFVDDVQQGQVDLDVLSHAMHMYELYKKSTPKVQEMIEYLLDEGNSSKASQQD